MKKILFLCLNCLIRISLMAQLPERSAEKYQEIQDDMPATYLQE